MALLSCTLLIGLSLLAPFRDRKRANRVGLVLSVGVAALSLMPLAGVGEAMRPRLVWIHGIEPVGFVAQGLARELVVMVFWALPLALGLHELSPPEGRASRWPALACLLCALVVSALTVDQFLARLVFLDCLSILLTALLHFNEPTSGNRSATLRRFLRFRLGDLGLLLMVLLLWRASGTFRIADMLEHAGSLSSRDLVPICLSGLLAVWVKLALPPFDGWMDEVAAAPVSQRIWVSGVTLPLLGSYLLFGMGGLISSARAIVPLIVIGGAIFAWGLARVVRSDRSSPANHTGWLTMHSALGLCVVGTDWARPFLLSFVLLRSAVCALMELNAMKVQRSSLQSAGPSSLERTLAEVVAFEAVFEQHVLEAVNSALAHFIFVAADATHRYLEIGLFERLTEWLVGGVTAMSTGLQLRHTGRLRRNLLWTSGALAALMAITIIWIM